MTSRGARTEGEPPDKRVFKQHNQEPGNGSFVKKLWMLFLWGDGATAAAAVSGLRRVAQLLGGSSSQPQASHLACAASSVSSVHAEQARGAAHLAAERPSREWSVVSAGVGGAGAGSAACSSSGSDSSSGSVVPPSEDPQLAEASATPPAAAACSRDEGPPPPPVATAAAGGASQGASSRRTAPLEAVAEDLGAHEARAQLRLQQHVVDAHPLAVVAAVLGRVGRRAGRAAPRGVTLPVGRGVQQAVGVEQPARLHQVGESLLLRLREAWLAALLGAPSALPVFAAEPLRVRPHVLPPRGDVEVATPHQGPRRASRARGEQAAHLGIPPAAASEGLLCATLVGHVRP
eukprot:scaffold31947_cov63-Phaeocystis_antarctica.AAC.7